MNLLIITIIVSSSLYIYFDITKKRVLKYVLKPLTTILVIILALQQSPEGIDLYGLTILFGLGFSLIGDVYLMLPTNKFIQGLAAFFIAHIFYIVAFSSGFGPFLDFEYLIPVAIYAIIFLWVLLPKTGKMKLPVIIYTFVLMIFMWQATGMYYYMAQTSAFYVFIGAIFFVISDTILAYAKFITNFRLSSMFIHSTYWGAQILIALSI